MDNDNVKTVFTVSITTLIGNIVLSAGKLIAGFFGKSDAMVSDAIHSASDALSTIIVMISVKLANAKEDKEHQYGHEKFECIAAVILAGMLTATAIGIGYGGVTKILSGDYSETVVNALPIIAAIISIVVKEAMFWYTRFYAKKVKSGAMMADAWHHRSDALSSVGSLLGIAGSMMGFGICDAIASIVICLMVLKAAYDICRSAFSQLVDTAADDNTVDEIKDIVLNVNGVKRIDSLKTRIHANLLYVDIEIAVDKEMSLIKSHAIAEVVHEQLEKKIDVVKHCSVHVNPFEEDIQNIIN